MENADNYSTYTPATELYDYQEADINKLFNILEQAEHGYKLLYQLPTGGGKTVIFSEIVNRFIHKYHSKVMILTHRQELSVQTSATLKGCGIKNKIINSSVKRLSKKEQYRCYVAMVETLNNRINDGVIDTSEIGLVIIDEAHHNSFQKLLDKFENAKIIGVTATPFSSDISLPMRDTYNELIVGESIESLIERGYLAEPATWRYDVELNTLQKNNFGDFTVSSSDELYASPAMLELLLHSYEEHSKNKKTLIFNNGIFASKAVCQMFNDAGYPARHLDNETPAEERAEILKWLKKTKNAILTSVSILTTGFDEPSVQTVILYRATTSLTLYHQMIGRGSRRLPSKKKFTIIDLGNNTDRFGAWNASVDWQYVFENPEAFCESIHAQITHDTHQMPSDMRSKFPNSLEISFDIQKAYHDALENNQKAKTVIEGSLNQHVQMCVDNSASISDAIALSAELDKEIEWRVKQYGKCLGKVTKNYLEWLRDDYKAKLKERIEETMRPVSPLRAAV
ncbi:DEAD/DEAH box helicase [Mucilaginibacter sp. Bleaf8]|uniref:DEAD/DEAH box helicase n=1 Tax=Mucilaginibacter sp. Bleaf8 TaxID=2834430 RepID=UPI001BCBC370|nr:DEAD/DEAH box helicase [Mucilaginibacter sp. Bleaf8]MBS7566830.1 DEAD/DEAH box helicase [Mucilaginibacter sp. Bleaf8]